MLKYLIHIKYQILFAATFFLFLADASAQTIDNQKPINESFILDDSTPYSANSDEEYLLDMMQGTPLGFTNTQKNNAPSLINKIEKEVSQILVRKRKFKSLMFTDSQIAELNAAIDSYKGGEIYLPDSNSEIAATEEEEVNKKSYIHLASILFFDDNDWTVWLNGEKITKQSNHPANELYILSINKNEIEVLWTISVTKWRILLGRRADDLESQINLNNQVEAKFTLRPNQTYLLVDDIVAEGYTE